MIKAAGSLSSGEAEDTALIPRRRRRRADKQQTQQQKHQRRHQQEEQQQHQLQQQQLQQPLLYQQQRQPSFSSHSREAHPRWNPPRPAGSTCCCTCDRFLLLVLFSLGVAVTLVFQGKMQELAIQLETERDHITHLEDVIQQHEHVIQRFNGSVTNSDVIGRLDSLETNFNYTRKHVDDQLDRVQEDIAYELKSTIQDLNETVTAAKKAISDEVDKVKQDVEKYTVATEAQFSMENSFMVYQIAGTFTLLSCLISMWHMSAHVRKMNQPDVQRKILAILWMTPVYAITSWFSLVFVSSAEGYLAIIKDGYEAYIIYQFLAFCIAVLGNGDRNKVVDLLARRADHLKPPYRLFACCECLPFCRPEAFENDHDLADAILLQCQLFTMQFVFFRPVITLTLFVLNKMEYYGEGSGPIDFRAPQFYLNVIQNISIFTAFTGLLKFYHAVEEDLAWLNPFRKFLCIKGIVFLTFWQGLVISLLAEATSNNSEKGLKAKADHEEWARASQNFLICLEMLLFSIAHFFCFPTEEWQEGYRVKKSRAAFGDSMALGDFFQDLKLVLRPNPTRKKHHKVKHVHPVIPEGDEDESSSKGGAALGIDDGLAKSSAASSLNGDDDDDDGSVDASKGSTNSSAEDPAVAEAKRRLLKSSVLQPEFFDPSERGQGDPDVIKEVVQGDKAQGDTSNLLFFQLGGGIADSVRMLKQQSGGIADSVRRFQSGGLTDSVKRLFHRRPSGESNNSGESNHNDNVVTETLQESDPPPSLYTSNLNGGSWAHRRKKKSKKKNRFFRQKLLETISSEQLGAEDNPSPNYRGYSSDTKVIGRKRPWELVSRRSHAIDVVETSKRGYCSDDEVLRRRKQNPQGSYVSTTSNNHRGYLSAGERTCQKPTRLLGPREHITSNQMCDARNRGYYSDDDIITKKQSGLKRRILEAIPTDLSGESSDESEVGSMPQEVAHRSQDDFAGNDLVARKRFLEKKAIEDIFGSTDLGDNNSQHSEKRKDRACLSTPLVLSEDEAPQEDAKPSAQYSANGVINAILGVVGSPRIKKKSKKKKGKKTKNKSKAENLDHLDLERGYEVDENSGGNGRILFKRHDDENTPSETTRLISSETPGPSNYSLRPSIFTTVATLVEEDQRTFEENERKALDEKKYEDDSSRHCAETV